jgi:hypothetical protein
MLGAITKDETTNSSHSLGLGLLIKATGRARLATSTSDLDSCSSDAGAQLGAHPSRMPRPLLISLPAAAHLETAALAAWG